MKKLILLLLPLMGAEIHAQELIPILNSKTTIGRIQMMESTNGTLTYVPALFSQRFSCSEENGICTLLIFNQMNEAEKLAIAALRNSGKNTLSLRPELFHDQIKIESEKLNSEIMQMQSNFFSMKNLGIYENSYGNSVFTAPRNDDIGLIQKYENEGLGIFNIKYQLNGKIRHNAGTVSETLESKTEHCTMSLPIKKNAEMIRNCVIDQE